jgi:glycerophosphoryl diester phosphodiesterase
VRVKPLVVAHRGSSHSIAEHTLAAYLRAIDESADGLECDVRLTRDGHLVCVHDRRIDRTSNGSGVVSEFDLAELGSFDFASWKDDLPDSADRFI